MKSETVARCSRLAVEEKIGGEIQFESLSEEIMNVISVLFIACARESVCCKWKKMIRVVLRTIPPTKPQLAQAQIHLLYSFLIEKS